MPKSRGDEDNDLYTVEIAIKGDYQKTQSIKMFYIDTIDEYNADFQVPIGATVYVTIEVYFQNDNTETMKILSGKSEEITIQRGSNSVEIKLEGMNIDLEITGENCNSVSLIPPASYNFTFSSDLTSEQAISFFSLLQKSWSQLGPSVLDMSNATTITSLVDDENRNYPADNIRKMILPPNITELGFDFLQCSVENLETIEIAPNGSTTFFVEDGILYQRNAETTEFVSLWCCPAKLDANEVTLNENTQEIKNYAFYGNENIEKINGLENIQTIEGSVFYNCKKIKELNLSGLDTLISTYNFQYCSAEKIIFSAGVTKIPCNSFVGCPNLKDIYFSSESPVELEPSNPFACYAYDEEKYSRTDLCPEFFDCNPDLIFHVISGMKAAYLSAADKTNTSDDDENPSYIYGFANTEANAYASTTFGCDGNLSDHIVDDIE